MNTPTEIVTHPLKKRATYGFKLDFPPVFTMRELRKTVHHKKSYICLYKRVEKAIKDGEVVELGKKNPDQLRKGRKETIYQRVNVQSVISPVTA
jgi:hypothetical protein